MGNSDRLQLICEDKIAQLETMREDSTTNPELHQRAESLEAQLKSLKRTDKMDVDGSTRLLGALHDFQRLEFLYQAKASDDVIAAADSTQAKEPNWKDINVLEVEPELRRQLAGRLIHSAFQHVEGGPFPNTFADTPPLSRDKTMLTISPSTRGVSEHIVSYCLKHDIPFDVDFADFRFNKALIENLSEEQIQAVAAFNQQKHNGVVKHFRMVSSAPEETTIPSDKDLGGEKKKLFQAGTGDFEKKRRSGEVFYTLTKVPTEEDAAKDGIPYKEYLKFFFELCDQPWKAIQEKNEKLINHLERAKTLSIIDDDTGVINQDTGEIMKTHLTMNIEGKLWANSTVLKNIPGSEVFTSPDKESVTGIYAVKGRFQNQGKNSPIMEDVWLKFENGKIVDFGARVGKEALAREIMADDDGNQASRFVGEIGIGTNPWLKRHVLNPLLVEKISGSAHIAIGSSYKYDHYDGKDLTVEDGTGGRRNTMDNGNQSPTDTHWDITAMLHGDTAKIVLDEKSSHPDVLQKAGQFLDPELEVLNKGWAADELKDQVPTYWKERLEQPREPWTLRA